MAKKLDAPVGTEVDKPAVTDMTALNEMYAKDIGAGFEEADASAFAIPFLQILQSGSPQCKKSDGAYIQGAEEGMFYDTVTQQIWDGSQPLVVVPCHFTQRFVEWMLREEGGGFIAEHLPTTPLVQQTTKDEKNRDILANGHSLVDTRNHYVLLLAGTEPRPMVLSMSSTQVKKSRNWMSKMNGIKIAVGGKFATAPMASRSYRLTTVPESNDQGSWFGWKIELHEPVQDAAIYGAAMEFRDAILKGRAKAVQPTPSPVDEEIAA